MTTKFIQEAIDTSALLAANEWVRKFQPIGSALFHDDPKDLDFLVLVKDADVPDELEVDMRGFFGHARHVFGPEWEVCGEYDETDDSWGSIRSGDVNLIVTIDQDWYERARLANELCVALRLKDKGDRIVAFRVIRDGYDAAGANARRDGST